MSRSSEGPRPRRSSAATRHPVPARIRLTGCSLPQARQRRMVFWYAAMARPGTTSGSCLAGQAA
eukprot:2496718-Alexandrium_andersonii.AAC.1